MFPPASADVTEVLFNVSLAIAAAVLAVVLALASR